MWFLHSSIARELVNHPLGTVQIHRAERTYRTLWWRARRTIEYIAFFPDSRADTNLSEDHLRAMRRAVGVGMSREAALLALAASYRYRMQLCERESESKVDTVQACASFPPGTRNALTNPHLQQVEIDMTC